MRTTLSLEDDVEAMLSRVRKSRKAGLKEIVNQALRLGLRAMLTQPRASRPFRTKTASLGDCLVGNLDDVAGVLAVVEDEAFK